VDGEGEHQLFGAFDNNGRLLGTLNHFIFVLGDHLVKQTQIETQDIAYASQSFFKMQIH